MTSKGPDWLIVAARRKYLTLTRTRTRLSAAVALLAPALLVTCGPLPTRADHPSSHAQPPSLDGPLARIAHDSTPAPAPSLSGFDSWRAATTPSMPASSWCAERVSRYSEKKTPKAMSSQISTPE
jgi:hypothetical protein